ncbi:MAG: ATP-dependent helicase, partial [Solirubrobacteraceae bacterium]
PERPPLYALPDPDAPPPAPRLNAVDPEQREAVRQTDGPLLVIAGAGSGKTRVMTERTAHLIEQGIAHPGQILSITFTNKAAGEMRERLARRVGPELAGAVTLGTFHALCARILRAHPGDSGRSARYSIYDEGDSKRVLERYLTRADKARIERDQVLAAISRAKNHLVARDRFLCATPDQLGGLVLHDDIKQIITSVWGQVDAELERSDALDFDDLIGFTVALLERLPDVLAGYRRRWRYLQVDEHQDTNPLQDRLLRLLAGENPNLMVVGDDQQAIYRFRSADVRNILRFDRDYPQARVVRLVRNYRSTPQIVNAANRLIAHNATGRPKTMVAQAPAGPEPMCRAHASEEAEARWAAAAIARAGAHGIARSEIAVLARAKGVLTSIESALVAAEIPYQVLSGTAFYQRREVKAGLAHLALLVNPHDAEAFSRVMLDARPGIGEVTAARVDAHATTANISLLEACVQADGLSRTRRDQKASLIAFGRAMLELAGQLERRSVSSLLAEIVRLPHGLQEALARHDDGETRSARLHDLVAAARAYERDAGDPSPVDFLARAALAAGADQAAGEPDPDRVTLCTVHGAKGLEWQVVLVCGLEEGTFPSQHAALPEAMEEERRLAYVAVTRAKRTLVLSHSHRRYGRAARPSRFIAEALCAPHGSAAA